MKNKENSAAVTAIIAAAAVIIVLLLCGTAIYAVKQISGSLGEEDREEVEVLTAATLEQQLQSASNLTSAELQYRGVMRFENGGTIPYIDKSSFSMVYSADIEAGIDISDVKIMVSDDTVYVTIPDAEVTDVNVDPASIEFYDERQSLMELIGEDSQKKEAMNAMVEAENDAREKADIGALLERADQQNEIIIWGIIEPMIGDRHLVIRHEGDEESGSEESTAAEE